MATVINDSPLPHFLFSNMDAAGMEFGVLLLKAAFDIASDGTCILSGDQEPFSFTDRFHGELNISSLREPSDLVSFKPKTDVIVDAVAHAPGGVPARSWEVGVEISSNAGRLAEKRLRVTGPRYWEPHWRVAMTDEQKRNWHDHRRLFSGWRLSDPSPVTSVPIRYELAFGGLQHRGTDENGQDIIEADENNPVGCGWIDREWTDHTRAVPAPQIETIGEPITDPWRRYEPAGFGPIPPAWLPRRLLGGTFDQNWIDNVWPRWPADYDFSYNNSAAAGLTLSVFPRGPLEIKLLNLRPQRNEFIVRLPDLHPIFIRDDGRQLDIFRPSLDTLTLSLAAESLFDCRVTVVWRAPFDLETTQAIAIDVPGIEERERVEREGEPVAEAQHPSACARPCTLLENV